MRYRLEYSRVVLGGLVCLSGQLCAIRVGRAADHFDVKNEIKTPPDPPSDPPPGNGFTCGLHFSVGFPWLESVPGERHIFATTVGFRAGYRFAPWFAVYGDLTVYASLGGFAASAVSAANDGVEHPRSRVLTAIPILSVPVAFRPFGLVELSVAPALGAYQIPVYGGKAHIAFPMRAGRATFSPTTEILALRGEGWKQITTTFGLGVDW